MDCRTNQPRGSELVQQDAQSQSLEYDDSLTAALALKSTTIPGCEEALVVVDSPGTPTSIGSPASSKSSFSRSSSKSNALSEPSVERARAMYATHHKISPAGVTDEMMAKTGGVSHWACLGLDMTARGDQGQRMNRAIAHIPKLKGLLNDLDMDLKLKFRKEFALHKSYSHLF